MLFVKITAGFLLASLLLTWLIVSRGRRAARFVEAWDERNN